ncbi:MAG: excisionase family DNA-binding protein [Thermacetogeniaceae bacterium]
MIAETLRPKEAAALLGISYWKILEMAKGGEIPHIRLSGQGGRVLFRRQALTDWMKEKEAASLKRESGLDPGKIRRLV